MKQFKPYKLFQTVIMLLLAIMCFYLALQTSYLEDPSSLNIYLSLLFICVLVAFIFSFISILFDLSLFHKMSIEYFDVNKIAHFDQLTGTSNRYSFDLLLNDFVTPDDLLEIGCVVLSLSNLPTINKDKGYKGGDEIIRDFAEILSDISESFGIFGRNSGNEFIVVMHQCNNAKIKDFIEELNMQVYAHNALLNYQGIDYVYGYVLNREEHLSAISEIISLSIRRMQSKNTI